MSRSTFKHITIDGSFDDWTGVPLAYTAVEGPATLEGRPRWDDVSLPLGRTVIEKPEILFRKLEKPELERVKSIVTKSTDAKDYFR